MMMNKSQVGTRLLSVYIDTVGAIHVIVPTFALERGEKMAISFTKTGVEENLSKVNLAGISLQAEKIRETNSIKALQEREQKLLDKFFNGMTHKEFKAAIKKIKNNANRLGLTAQALRLINTKYKANTGDQAAKEQEKFTNEILNLWQTYEPSDSATKDAEHLILDILKTTYGQSIKIGTGKGSMHSGIVRSLKSLRGINTEEEIANIYLNDLAKVTQARIRRWLKVSSSSVGKVEKSKSPPRLTVEPAIDWFKYTKGKKASEVDLNDKAIQKKIVLFKQDLINYIRTQAPEIKHVADIVDYVISKDPTAIFIGENEKAITGLCGEIEALCYLGQLLGDKFSLNPKVLDWAAKNKDNGKQYHADILLNDFGIQVKNSTKDIMDEDISFVNSSLKTFLLKVLDSAADVENIMSIYQAYYFNQPYIATYNKATGTASFQIGNNQAFSDTRQKIESLKAAADSILNKLEATLLYIGVGDASDNQFGNVMFFVGGELFFASEILTDILDKIGAISNFNVDISYNSNYNITTFLNDNGPQAFRSPNNTQLALQFADSMISDNIKLTSSYNFGSLLK